MKDLKPGMVLKGTVRNVIDFGCFVDIGVHQDGLVHISHITDRYIKHPLEAVSVGDIVDVQVLDVELDKKRISLTMKIGDPAKVAAEAAAKAAQRASKPASAASPAKTTGSSAAKAPAKKSASTAAPKKTVSKAASSADAAAKPAASKPATSAAPAPAASTSDAAPVKKLKKKGIVIFKGNAND